MAGIYTLGRKPQRIYASTDRRSQPRGTEDRRRALQRRILYEVIAYALNQGEINKQLREIFALTMPAAIRHEGYLLQVFLESVAEELVRGIEGHSISALSLQEELIRGGVVLDDWGLEVRSGTYNNIVGERMSVITLLDETVKEQRRISQLEEAFAFADTLGVEPVENRKLLIDFLKEAMAVVEAKSFTLNIVDKTWQQHRLVRGEEIDLFKNTQVPSEGTEEAFLSSLLGQSRAETHLSNGNGEYEFYRAKRGGWGFLLVPASTRKDFAGGGSKKTDIFYLFLRRGQNIVDVFSLVKEDRKAFFDGQGQREEEISLIKNIIAPFRRSMETAERFQELRDASEKDPLTQLWNKRPFSSAFAREVKMVARHGCALSLVILDIDHFKNVNDTFGHGAGDTVLKVLAKIIKEEIRETDYCSRDGGEEFALLLPKTNREGAQNMTERLRKRVEQEKICITDNEGDLHEINVTVSIGVTTLDRKNLVELDAAKGAADKALYKAKKSGRNRVVIGELY